MRKWTVRRFKGPDHQSGEELVSLGRLSPLQSDSHFIFS